MAEIVSVPDRHVCEGLARPAGAGWWYPAHVGPGIATYPDGTVSRCGSCGRTWVSGHVAGYMPSIWRREGWLERRLRERRERRS